MDEPRPGDVLVRGNFTSYHQRNVYIVTSIHSRYDNGELRSLTVRRRGEMSTRNYFARNFKSDGKYNYLRRECVWNSK